MASFVKKNKFRIQQGHIKYIYEIRLLKYMFCFEKVILFGIGSLKLKTMCFQLKTDLKQIFVLDLHYRYKELKLFGKRVFKKVNSNKKDLEIDKKIIPEYYFLKYGFYPNLSNPEKFSEHLQLLKLKQRKKIFSELVDKNNLSQVIQKHFGAEYALCNYGVYNSVSAFAKDLKNLPKNFILKTNNWSGGVFYVDKEKGISHAIYENLKNMMSSNYYLLNCEYPYKNIKPKIIAQEVFYYHNIVKDFSCHTIKGKVRFVDLYVKVGEGLKDFGKITVDMNYNKEYSLWFGDANNEKTRKSMEEFKLKKPDNFEKIIDLVESIAQKFDLLYSRVDILSDGKEKIKINEITLYPAGGLWGSSRMPESVDTKIGKMFR